MPRRRLPDFDIQNRRGANPLQPGVLPEGLNRESASKSDSAWTSTQCRMPR